MREADQIDVDWVEVGPGVLVRRHAGLVVTSTAILGPTGSVVVDTLPDPRAARRARRSLEDRTGVPVVGLVLTHAHYDHTFGTAAYPGVPTYGHHRLAEHLRAHEAPELAAGRAGELELDGDPTLWGDVVLPGPDHTITGAATIRPGGRAIVLEAWPAAHSSCDLVVHVPDAHVWVVGDVVEESNEPSFETDSDPVGWARALAGLVARVATDDVVVPGHGDPVGRDFVAAQAAELASLAAALESSTERGASEVEAIRSLHEATGWHAKTLRRAARAHLSTSTP